MKTTTREIYRQLIFVMIFIFITTVFNSGTKPPQWSDWSVWKTSDCYTGITFRHRDRVATDDKNQVQMEIKNNYSVDISISHYITTDPSAPTIYRFDVKSGGVYTSEQFVDKDKKWFLLLDKLRFEGDKYGDPYRGCNEQPEDKKETEEKDDPEESETEEEVKQETKKNDDFWNGGENKTESKPKDKIESETKKSNSTNDDFWTGQGSKSDEIALEKKIAQETDNQYLGEKEVLTKRIRISYRDHGDIDGDRVSVFHNGGVVADNITLTADEQNVTVTLQEGINRISFSALNQGSLGKNTAEFNIYDEEGKSIYTDNWSITTGYRGTLIVIKK